MRRIPLPLVLLALTLLAGCAHSPAGPASAPMSLPPGTEEGSASFYGAGDQGDRTASGTRFDRHALTAAHPTLPFGTRVRVTNLDNGRSVVVTITDRGPHRGGRIIDLSQAAAHKLGFVREGTARVRVQVLTSSRAE
jgi:rare lipoprotein A